MGDDVHGAGDHDHPGDGLVEGQVLVQQTLHLPRRTLEGGRARRVWQLSGQVGVEFGRLFVRIWEERRRRGRGMGLRNIKGCTYDSAAAYAACLIIPPGCRS